MSYELSDLMRQATAELRLPPDTAEIVIVRRKRQRRRRQLATLSVAGVVTAAAVAVPLGLGLTNGSGSDVNRIVPVQEPAAVPAPSFIASVDGVELRYLPAGFRPSGALGLDAMRKENGRPSVSQYYRPAGRTYVSGMTPELSLAVQRGLTLDLEAFARSSVGGQESWLTIRGKRALLQTFPATGSGGNPGYELTWVEQPSLTLTLFSDGGLPLTEVRHVADGVVALPGRGPADLDIATSAVTQAVTTAFSGDNSDAMGAVTDGTRLRAALEKLARDQPDLVRTVRVTSIDVRFVSDSRAVVRLNVVWEHGSAPGEVTVARGGDRWLVEQSSFCSMLSVYLPRCPAP